MNVADRIHQEGMEMSTEAIETGTSKPKAKKAAKQTKGRKAKAAVKPAGKKASKPIKETARTKKAIVLEMLRREQGATIDELAKSTGWQNHSIRGFLSGTVTKKMGLRVESSKRETGERTYRITE